MIDEADEMLEADWEEEFKKIMSGGGKLLKAFAMARALYIIFTRFSVSVLLT